MWREAADKFWDVFQLHKVRANRRAGSILPCGTSPACSSGCLTRLDPCIDGSSLFTLDRNFPSYLLWQVYYISGGQLKMANRKFSTVKNEYELNLGGNARVSKLLRSSTPAVLDFHVRFDGK